MLAERTPPYQKGDDWDHGTSLCAPIYEHACSFKKNFVTGVDILFEIIFTTTCCQEAELANSFEVVVPQEFFIAISFHFYPKGPRLHAWEPGWFKDC